MNIIAKAERKIEMSIIEKLIAGLIERSCKNYVTTIIGVLSVLVYAANTFTAIVPLADQAYVNAAAVVAAGVALILAKDAGVSTSSIPTVTK